MWREAGQVGESGGCAGMERTGRREGGKEGGREGGREGTDID